MRCCFSGSATVWLSLRWLSLSSRCTPSRVVISLVFKVSAMCTSLFIFRFKGFIGVKLCAFVYPLRGSQIGEPTGRVVLSNKYFSFFPSSFFSSRNSPQYHPALKLALPLASRFTLFLISYVNIAPYSNFSLSTTPCRRFLARPYPLHPFSGRSRTCTMFLTCV